MLLTTTSSIDSGRLPEKKTTLNGIVNIIIIIIIVTWHNVGPTSGKMQNERYKTQQTLIICIVETQAH